MQDPLKQGLKLFYPFLKAISDIQIRMQDPLKQGLKHYLSRSVGKDRERIRMQDPLKQGLKRFKSKVSVQVVPYSNARSIKTRIETRFYCI